MLSAPFHRNADFSEGDPSTIQVIHYLLPEQKQVTGLGAPIPVDAMEHQFELLDRWGFTLITFEDHRLFREGELHLPRKPLIVTFDGPTHAVTRHILPFLRTNGLRAVVFVRTGLRPLDGMPGADQSDAEFQLDTGHLMALQNAGCEIGSLTCSNRPLVAMAEDAVRRELHSSREILEKATGTQVLTLAYPHGETSPTVKRIAEESGYLYAVGGMTPHMVFGSDLLEIRRRTIDQDTGTMGLALSVFSPGSKLGSFGRRSLARVQHRTGASSTREAL